MNTKKLALMMSLFSLDAMAQSYHNDTIINGVRTLKVEGNLLLDEYNSGSGGNLSVLGDSNLSIGAVSLPMPSGVSGYYHGPVRMGGSTTIGEYRFEKLGDEATGDFIVPLGLVQNCGANINIEVQTAGGDPNSGGASFSLLGKTHRELGKVTAVSHSAFGGGCGVKIYALNQHGYTWMYLQFDALNYSPGQMNNNIVRVRMTTFGEPEPMNRAYSFEQMFPVVLANSLVANHISSANYNYIVGSSVQYLNAENTVLNGKVIVSAIQGDISMGIYE
ncbi:MAG: hypothetical protein V4584_00945 [Verrucomicrobiota bacterium]